MIIMSLKLDNLFAFKDFELDMSYPKKTVRSPIKDEHLSGFPNFRYKKVNVILGSNASGKTTLGKAMMCILNFIASKNSSGLEAAILDSDMPASFSIDFIVHGSKLNRIMLDIIPDSGKRILAFSYDYELIKLRDSYQICAARLSARERVFSDYNTTLDAIEKPGWLFSYPDTTTVLKPDAIPSEIQLKAMKAVLMTLDPSISDVRLLDGVKDTGFIIDKDGREILLQNGRLTDPDRFSSGTREGVSIAAFLSAILAGKHGFYYCDEKFSYIHSSIEKRMLAIMISNLGENEQLFFTTHNETVMEENLPKHSFVFLVRENGIIRPVYANDFVQKASDNLRRAVENEVIKAFPDDRLLDDLES